MDNLKNCSTGLSASAQQKINERIAEIKKELRLSFYEDYLLNLEGANEAFEVETYAAGAHSLSAEEDEVIRIALASYSNTIRLLYELFDLQK